MLKYVIQCNLSKSLKEVISLPSILLHVYFPDDCSVNFITNKYYNCKEAI